MFCWKKLTRHINKIFNSERLQLVIGFQHFKFLEAMKLNLAHPDIEACQFLDINYSHRFRPSLPTSCVQSCAAISSPGIIRPNNHWLQSGSWTCSSDSSGKVRRKWSSLEFEKPDANHFIEWNVFLPESPIGFRSPQESYPGFLDRCN